MESENPRAESETLESKEQPGRYNELIIDLVRHGESNYTNISPDLTQHGQNQIQETGTLLAEALRPNEKVVIWTSPAARTKDSSQIIRKILEQKGAKVVKEKEVETLRPMRIDDMEFVQELFKEVAEQGRPDTAFMTHPEFAKERHDKMETRPQVEKRIDRIINYLRYLVEHVDFQDQSLRMILLSHFEVAEPLAQEVFGAGVPFRQGENLEIKMLYDRIDKSTKIYFSFRGQEKGPFEWNKQTRELK